MERMDQAGNIWPTALPVPGTMTFKSKGSVRIIVSFKFQKVWSKSYISFISLIEFDTIDRDHQFHNPRIHSKWIVRDKGPHKEHRNVLCILWLCGNPFGTKEKCLWRWLFGFFNTNSKSYHLGSLIPTNHSFASQSDFLEGSSSCKVLLDESQF